MSRCACPAATAAAIRPLDPVDKLFHRTSVRHVRQLRIGYAAGVHARGAQHRSHRRADRHSAASPRRCRSPAAGSVRVLPVPRMSPQNDCAHSCGAPPSSHRLMVEFNWVLRWRSNVLLDSISAMCRRAKSSAREHGAAPPAREPEDLANVVKREPAPAASGSAAPDHWHQPKGGRILTMRDGHALADAMAEASDVMRDAVSEAGDCCDDREGWPRLIPQVFRSVTPV